MCYCGLYMQVGEIRAYLSDLTLHQSRAVLDATLQVRGTVVGVAIPHPPGSSHPSTGAWDPAVTVSQGSSVTFSDGAMENIVVCVRSSHMSSSVGHWEDGVCRERVPMQWEWLGSWAQQCFTATGEPPPA